MLRASYANTADEGSLISRFAYRPISFYLTVPFARLGCSANSVTLLRIPVATIGSVLMATGLWSLVLAGSILRALGTFLDYVDGNLARFSKSASAPGELLDGIAHIFERSLLPIGIAIGLCFRPDRVLHFHHVNSFLVLSLGFVVSAISFSHTALSVLSSFIALQACGTASRTSEAEVNVHQIPLIGRNGRHGLTRSKWIKHKLRSFLVESGFLLDVAGIIIFAVADLMSVCLLALCVQNAFRLRDKSGTLLELLNASGGLHKIRNLS